MFKGFMPKIAAIPASAIPLHLSTFGHKLKMASCKSKINLSERSCNNYNLYSLSDGYGAFVLKLKYPLYTSAATERVRNGIAVPFQKVASVDPCSGLMYLPVDFLDEEIETVEVMNHFRNGSYKGL